MSRYAALDIGTNSTKMTIADLDERGAITVVSEDSDITRLGEGVDQTKRLSDAAMARTREAIARFAAEARRQGASAVLAAGTSALRDAENGSDFIVAIKRETGIEIEIITGDREARLAYGAVRSDASLPLSAETPLLVFDIGGGSTELILGDSEGVIRHVSLDIGAVRLTERFLKTDPPTDSEVLEAAHYAERSLATFAKPSAPPQIAGIGGTAVNLAAVAKGPAKADPDALHGTRLTAADVRAALERFCRVPLEERRRIPGLEPKRADVITAGTVILDRLLARFDADHLVVSVRGLRYGLLSEQAKPGR